ncbi:MAG: HAMP domain-containing histidine kinase [Ignavibacteria bacterium]|nr:HAMP domain-containing histidine kinase [Ignavibacteria bacterium]
MSARMLALTPQWIMFDQFWIALKRRNLWLITLRYGAVLALTVFLAGMAALPQLQVDTLPIAIITVCILAYNVVLHRSIGAVPAAYAPFHGLHFALIQISADLLVLMGIMYFTGGIESPFFLFFLFHIIIGSLILPSAVVSVVIAVSLSTMLTGVLLEYHGTIPHHAIVGFLGAPLYTNAPYIIVFFLVFTFTLLVSNYLANSISKELYLRERSLTRAYKQLEEAEKTKSRYVMSVVHDLKTPIAAAITYINMLLDKSFGALSEEMERPLERSRARLSSAITLINDILQLSQVKLANRIEAADINLTEMLEDIYDEMRIMFMAKKIRFTTWTNAEEDLHIEAEPRLLKLALGNLISNAHKYTESEGVVEVHLKERDDLISIEIADTGIGIPKGELNRIFDDFYRTTVSKKKTTEGTGLGLSIVKQIIHQFHGSISVDSPSRLGDGAERPGTAFFITLPKRFVETATELEDDHVEMQEQNTRR